MTQIPYIGSKISLITTHDIRYEGILNALNQKESELITVACAFTLRKEKVYVTLLKKFVMIIVHVLKLLNLILKFPGTIQVQNVRSFGTEGRKKKKEDEVPMSNEIYDSIVFSGKDLQVSVFLVSFDFLG